MFAQSRIFHLMIFLALLTMVIGVVSVQAASTQGQPSQSNETSQMLQFTGSGHMLGFRASGVYVATGNYMLWERFAGTNGTVPQAERPSAKKGQPLERVCYPDLWEGIDMIYDSPPSGILRSTYLVDAGADPAQIALYYNVPMHLDTAGNLVFELETGTMIASAPIAWQEIEEKHIPVDVAFDLNSSQSTVHFSLGKYNPAFPLTIDPTLAWHTFMGSSDEDYGRAIAVDWSGNVYVAGGSEDPWGSPVNPHAGWEDAFVAKLDSSGVTVWTTFMGSEWGIDYGDAIAVADSGNVYVAGYSDASWGSPVDAYTGSYDAFVAKLDSSGVSVWNTFMGSGSNDYGRAIAVDEGENVYVAGYSEATWGSPVNDHAGAWDAFAAKLTSSGVTVWNTFMGSGSNDYGYAIAVDGSENVYVAGRSYATWGSPVNGHAGNYDAFAAKLNSSGVTVWNTFMGSPTSDFGYAIAVDGSGNVYVAGESDATWGSPVDPYAQFDDAFAAKLDSSGVTVWTTFMGGGGDDAGRAIAVDGKGNVYIAGEGGASWGNPVNPYVGGGDALAAVLNKNGMRKWHTFMGCGNGDCGYAVAVDRNGNVYVAGESYNSWGSPVNPFTGSMHWDAFAAKLSNGVLTPGIPLLLLDSP